MNDMFSGKTITVLGMARSGVAAAKLLHGRGARVRINDMKTMEQLGDEISGIAGLDDVECFLGEPADRALAGCDIMVISPGVPIESDVVARARKMGVEVIGEIELAERISRARLVAITGTNGKTTTTQLTGDIFAASGQKTYVVGNIGYPFAAVAGETQPSDNVICEVSSFQLESVNGFHPKAALITNIREDHLNRHHTMEIYAATKERIFERQTAEDTLALFYDDMYLIEAAKRAPSHVVYFSATQIPPEGAFVVDGDIVWSSGGTRRRVCPVSALKLPGRHNLENALGAVALAMSQGIPPEAVEAAIRAFKGVEYRMEYVRTLDGVRYIDDTEGTNADSTVRAVEAMSDPTVLILGGSDKKNDFTQLCRMITDSRWISHVVLIGQTAGQFDRTLREAGYPAERIHHGGTDFEGAIGMARGLAVSGGTVLLSPACASFDMFKNAEQRGDIFKEIVRKLG